MPITDWLPEQRPREKLLTHGASYLTDAELLAIFLRVGMIGKSAVDLAHELITHFGSLSAMFKASIEELSTIKGIGEAKFVQLQAVLEMSRRALSDQLSQTDVFHNIGDLKTFVQLQLADATQETLIALHLSPRLALISVETIATGDFSHIELPIRALVQQALDLNTHGLVLAHNHPKGVAIASSEDILTTNKLKEHLRPLNLFILDHLIVAEGNVISMAEQNLINAL